MKKHAYLIMAHNEFHMLKKLISQLDDPRNDIYIHIDKKTRFVDESEIASWAEKSGIYFIKRRKIYWGTLSIVKGELDLLAAATKGRYFYYHLISGVDLELKSQNKIHDYLKNGGVEYVAHHSPAEWDDFLYKVKYYHPLHRIVGKGSSNCKGKKQRILRKLGEYQWRLQEFQRRHNVDRTKKYKNTTFYKGNQWFSITHEFAEYVLSKKRSIMRMYWLTNAPDEIFLPTLAMNSEFRDRTIDVSLREIDWVRGDPYEYKMCDFEELKNSDAFFARKVSYDRDPGLVNEMNRYIGLTAESDVNCPLISMIVPCYNVEEYLEKCVDSLSVQTYPNTEIILIDDGATDNTGTLAEKLGDKYNNVYCYHKTNGGLSSARNYGIDKANGTYISFIDADDWVEPDYVERLYEAIRINHADIAVCGYRLEEAQSGLVTFDEDQLISPHEAMKILGDIYPKENVLLVVAWNKLYKRSLFDNIRYTESKIHEDEHIAHHILGEADSVVLITDALYHYRIREGSITSAGKSQSLKRLDYMDAIEDRLIYCRSMMYGDVFIYMLYTYYEGLKQLMVTYSDETIEKNRLYAAFRQRAAKIYFRYFFELDNYQKKDYLKMILFTRKYRKRVIDLIGNGQTKKAIQTGNQQ